jgi:hypothetical protein
LIDEGQPGRIQVMQVFELKLLNQHWFENRDDPNSMQWDTTTHGNIRLAVNGEDISGCDLPDNELGINQSSVALLRSVLIDHELDENDPLFYHGCWILGTCPNRIIDFRVTHDLDDVNLDHFVVSGVNDPKKHFEKRIVISNREYAEQILEFAREAFKILSPKRGDLDYEAAAYISLKKEHKILILMVEEFVRTGIITNKMTKRAESFKL